MDYRRPVLHERRQLLQNVEGADHDLELALVELLGVILEGAVLDEEGKPVGVRADLDQLLSEGEQPFDFVVVLEQVGEGYLKQGQLVGEDLEVAAAAAGEGLSDPEGHLKNNILSLAI